MLHSGKIITALSALVLALQVSVSAASGTVNTDALNVRSEANTYSSVVGTVYSGAQVDITGRSGEFYEINYNGSLAYVHKDYVTMAPTVIGYVNTSLLNIRTGPGTSYSVMGQLAIGDGVDITEADGEWYQIIIGNRFGYVHSGYITTTSQSIRRVSSSASRSGTSVSRKGTALVEYSKNFIGTPYVSGGTSPSGFDCSGFTYYVYKQYGVTLPRTAASQAGAGVAVSRSELVPGDLVFFDTYGGISHVGIFVGGDSFIHATVPGDVVKIGSLNSSYYKSRYITARRIFN